MQARGDGVATRPAGNRPEAATTHFSPVCIGRPTAGSSPPCLATTGKGFTGGRHRYRPPGGEYARIRRMFDELAGALKDAGPDGPADGLGRAWLTLAALLETHLDAVAWRPR